jgi:hypothetical protein
MILPELLKWLVNLFPNIKEVNSLKEDEILQAVKKYEEIGELPSESNRKIKI